MNSNNSVQKILSELEKKQDITEVIFNGPQSIFIERNGEFVKLNAQTSEKDILDFAHDIAKFNHKDLGPDRPILDGNLPDGSRVNIIIPPYASDFPAITIRKYIKTIKKFDSSPGIFGLSPKWVELIQCLVKSRMNIVVSGGTGVGKTTFMNLMLQEVPSDQRVISIEDTRELTFDLPNAVRLEARLSSSSGLAVISMRDLVKNALRMRPDRIIIGEARGGELFDLLQAMNTGHQGSITSIHSNNTQECLQRMENLFYMSGFDVPSKVIRQQFSTAVDFIIQLGRLRDGTRVVKQISEITGMESDRLLLNEIAKVSEKGVLKSTGLAVKRMEQLMQAGLPQDFFATK